MLLRDTADVKGVLRCFIFLSFLIILFSVLSPYFLTLSNFENIIAASTVTGLLALGVTFVIGSGGIDLSVASVMALSGTLCALLVQGTSWSPFAAVAISLCTGGGAGLITGILINLTRAPSFIVTLGMLSLARAAAYIVSDGTPIYDLPPRITEWGQGFILYMPGTLVILLLAGLLAYYLLHCTPFGVHTLILGDNPFAARAMGIKLMALKIKIYTLAGLYAGLAGYVFMARTNAGDPTAGQNYELIAITAVILGGTNLFGGQATILGTLLGTFCLGVLQNGLNLLAVSTYYQILFVGLVLIIAAFLERIQRTE